MKYILLFALSLCVMFIAGVGFRQWMIPPEDPAFQKYRYAYFTKQHILIVYYYTDSWFLNPIEQYEWRGEVDHTNDNLRQLALNGPVFINPFVPPKTNAEFCGNKIYGNEPSSIQFTDSKVIDQFKVTKIISP